MIGIKKHMTKIKKPNTIKLNTIKSPQVVYNYIILILIILSSKIKPAPVVGLLRACCNKNRLKPERTKRTAKPATATEQQSQLQQLSSKASYNS